MTNATLTHIFYPPAFEQSRKQNLPTELIGFVQEDGLFDAQSLAVAERWDAIINETPRLHSAVPLGLSRQVPKRGADHLMKRLSQVNALSRRHFRVRRGVGFVERSYSYQLVGVKIQSLTTVHGPKAWLQ
jgi:hypothetical protein